MPTSSHKGGLCRSQWRGSTNPTNERRRGWIHRHPRLPLAWLPTKPWTTFHARDLAFKNLICVSLSRLLTSQLPLGSQLGREGGRGCKGGDYGGCTWGLGMGAVTSDWAAERGLPGLRLGERDMKWGGGSAKVNYFRHWTRRTNYKKRKKSGADSVKRKRFQMQLTLISQV